MNNGKFGLNITAIAVIAFIFTALSMPQAVLLVAGFALLAERNEWLNKQTIQALLLTLVYNILMLVLNFIFSGLMKLLTFVDASHKALENMRNVNNNVTELVYIAFVVICIFAILRTMHGKDANLLILSKMSGGNIAETIEQLQRKPTYAQQQTYAQHQSFTPAQQPTQPQQSVPSTSITPIQPAVRGMKVCRQCGNSLSADSRFCVQCGTAVIG